MLRYPTIPIISESETDYSDTGISIEARSPRRRTFFRRRSVSRQRRPDYSNAYLNPVVQDLGGLQRSASTGARRLNHRDHHREPEHPQRDYDMLVDQQMLQRNNTRQDLELMKQQAEIERLEKELAHHREEHKAHDDECLNHSHEHRLVSEEDLEPMKQQAEIERLERELARRHEEHESHSRIDHVFPVGGYQLVLSPHVVKDSTVHFEMDIEEDLEAQLEEFSRLKRLGLFSAAWEMFQSELAEHTAYSFPVLIEYADMLYEQGHYRALLDLMREYSQHLAKWKVSGSDQMLFTLNEALAETLSGGYSGISRRRYLAKTDELFAERDIDGIKLQILNRLLRLWTVCDSEKRRRKQISRLVQLRSHPVTKALIAQERFWEFKDLIVELTNYDVEGAWLNVFLSSYGDDTSLRVLIEDWTLGPYDESSYLALLDILVAFSGYPVSKQPASDNKSLPAFGRILQWARQVANTIEAQSPGLVKSRPYLRWILAEAEHSRRLEGDVLRQHLSRFPGVTVYRSLLPMYIPSTCENPGWPAVHAHPQYTKLVQIALHAAQENGDYQTEILCLQELICRSSHPQELFEQLMQRQKVVEGSSIAYQQTRVSTYLIGNKGSSESLGTLLNEYHFGDSPTQAISRRAEEGLTPWCYAMLRRAYAIYEGQNKDKTETEAFCLLSRIPRDISSIVHRKAILISRRQRRISITIGNDLSSDSDVEYFDSRDSRRQAEAGSSRERSIRHSKIPEAPKPTNIHQLSKPAINFSKYDPPRSTRQRSIESDKHIHNSTKLTGADEGIQTKDQNDKHTAKPYGIGDELDIKGAPKNYSARNLDPAEEDGSQEPGRPPTSLLEGRPPMQPQVDEKSPSPPELP